MDSARVFHREHVEPWSKMVAYSVLEEETESLDEHTEYPTARKNNSGRSLYADYFVPVGQQFSVGTFLGLATGYSLRRIGRFALFLLGAQILILQWMAYKGWVTIHWNRVSRDLVPVLDKSFAENMVDILVYKMPFATAFCVGLKLAP